MIWCLEDSCAADINQSHENKMYLPGFDLHPALKATSSMSDMAGKEAILMVTPAQHMRASLKAFRPYAETGLPVVTCSKGIELGTLSLMTDIMREEVPEVLACVLSGPSFAKDIVIGLPTAVTLACEDKRIANMLAEDICTQTFRPYVSHDLVGAEIGGAVKNVLAIACGITLGMGLGRSAHAALIARGFAEMSRLGTALGAETMTLTGLCGFGDLVLTCSSEMSRNMSCGMALGQGKSLESILNARSAVTEGVSTAPAIAELSKKLGISMPICETVAKIVDGRVDVNGALDSLLNRPLRYETS